jgi:Putative addiction module component
MSLTEIKTAIDELKPEELAEIWHYIDVKTMSDEEFNALWGEEITHRVTNLRSGKSTTRPAKEVMDELRNRLRR